MSSFMFMGGMEAQGSDAAMGRKESSYPCVGSRFRDSLRIIE